MKKIVYLLTLTVMGFALALPLQADDTNIYGGGNVSVEPNILIIFDTSGSMSTDDVQGEMYDPNHFYSGLYPADKVYEGGSEFAENVSDLQCPDVVTALLTDGRVTAAIYNGDNSPEGFNYFCGGNSRTLRLGNYRNYESTVGTSTRISVAKQVITNLINTTDGVRFGLMRFNYNQGGRVVEYNGQKMVIGADKEDLIAAVDNLPAEGWTPLAETLAEAGLYFAGKDSWYNSGDSAASPYPSPLQYTCQKNYIILMTDGEPTEDNDSRLQSENFVNSAGDSIGDYDGDGNSGRLDDVAKYLYDNDIDPNLGAADDSFEKQNIITYTIGFQSDQQLLRDTAANGGGEYYTATSISGLADAFESIVSKIKEVNAVFVSPVVPMSRMNRAYAGNSLYVGFFKPLQSGRWAGNVKKYAISNSGDILDKNLVAATNSDGSIKDNAISFWSSSIDGPDVTKGGVGGVLLDNPNRTLYTYLDSQLNLTDNSNAFSTSNTSLTDTILGVSGSTERSRIIDDIHGVSSSWKMGDVLHSQPAVTQYDTDGDGDVDESYLFVGTNGGMLHSFKDSTGDEEWGFIPPDQLSRLQMLSDSNTVHDYYMDSAPVIYKDGSDKTLIFGERRGGSSYYVLDITDPATPTYKYAITPDLLTGLDSDNDGYPDDVGARLGQSWSMPTVHTIKTGTYTNDFENVFLMTGGYDTNQDLDSPASSDTVGKSVFTVDVTDGSVSALNFNSVNLTGMNNCITDAMGFDFNGDTYTDRVYAGDLAGNMWAFEDHYDPTPAPDTDTSIVPDGTWGARKLFSAGALDSVQRKIFYSPDVVGENGEDMIFFGTGDRADPEEIAVVNRIYAIKNDWVNTGFTTLTENDLVDVTANLIQLGTDVQKDAVKADLDSKRGWFFELENPGEKIISSVIVYAGVLYFTSYEPETGGSVSSDPCTNISGRGVARFYAVDYKTGAAVKNYSSTTEVDGEGETVTYGKLDRSKIVGTSIASAPVIAVLPEGAVIYLGIEGGIGKEDPVEDISLHRFYWRQAFR